MKTHECKTTEELMKAVDTCAPGDVIHLAKGTYSLPGQLFFPHKTFTLRGEGSGVTKLESPNAVITFLTLSPSQGKITVEGVTLESGFHDGGGCGFAGEAADLLFRDVVFSDHKSPAQRQYSGAAVSARRGKVSFERCVFEGNRSDFGGAVALTDCETVSFVSCYFANNVATTGLDVFLDRIGQLEILGCTFGETASPGARVTLETDSMTSTRVTIAGSLFAGVQQPLSTIYPALLELHIHHNVFPGAVEPILNAWIWSREDRLGMVGGIPHPMTHIGDVPVQDYVRSKVVEGNDFQGNVFGRVKLASKETGEVATHPTPVHRLPPGTSPVSRTDLLGTARTAGGAIGCVEVP